MRTRLIGVMLFVSMVLVCSGLRAGDEKPEAKKTAEEKKAEKPYAKQMQQFAEKDEKTPPPADPILFVGSSSFTKWKECQKDMLPLVVINRGFGGSQISHQIMWFDQVVKKYKPSRIVMYCGENDINAGVSPEDVAGRFKTWHSMVKEALGDIPVYYVSMKPSIKRWKIWDKMVAGNKLISEYCEVEKNVTFIDVSEGMLKDGKPREDIWLKDNLHMNRKGYADIWIPAIKPVLETAVNKAK
ncbi:MAG: G-D-S-L family lipolytic protein [Planctomycetes bacterium]|nr:G-D-S-L family lipolytic protein [Planctomycetota bacterium]